MKRSQEGFGVIEIGVSLFAIALIALGGRYIWQYHQKHKNYSPAIQNGEIRLSGKITKDSCSTLAAQHTAISDSGCSIIVNGYNIGVVHGNINTPALGTVTGLNSSDQVGQTADIYAKVEGSGSASIWDSIKYYVHIH